MKKIILVVLILVLTATVANAASINGDFKGNPIVKVKADGKDLTVENTPAVIYNGNTLVPIYMLRQLGATVTWDQKTYSVDVKFQNNHTSTGDISKMKTLVWGLDYYAALNELGRSFAEMQYLFQVDHNFILDKFQVTQSLESSVNKLYSVIDEYNRLNIQADTMVNSLKSAGIVDTNIYTVFNAYLKSIDSFKLAMDELYYLADKKTDSNLFFEYLKSSVADRSKGLTASHNGYTIMYNAIQGFEESGGSATKTPTTIVPTTPTPDIVVTPTPSVIKSKIVGDFEGYEDGNIYELDNGQFWKQVDFTYRYRYKYRPEVLIYKDGFYYYMNVEGMDKDIKVELIN